MNRLMKISLMFMAISLVFSSGCMTNSLGHSAAELEQMSNYTEASLINEDGYDINRVDSKMVPMPRILAIRTSLVYSNSAVIEWETDIESDGYVDYGLTEVYGLSSYINTTMSKEHRVQLDSLNSGSQYSFRVVASRHSLDSSKVYSENYIFRTESQ